MMPSGNTTFTRMDAAHRFIRIAALDGAAYTLRHHVSVPSGPIAVYDKSTGELPHHSKVVEGVPALSDLLLFYPVVLGHPRPMDVEAELHRESGDGDTSDPDEVLLDAAHASDDPVDSDEPSGPMSGDDDAEEEEEEEEGDDDAEDAEGECEKEGEGDSGSDTDVSLDDADASSGSMDM
jgi:hypothetical protein